MKKTLFLGLVLALIVGSSGAFAYTYTVKNSSYCVLALPFDENATATANDQSGLNNDATLSGENLWVTGRYDTGLNFTGSGYGSFVFSQSLNISAPFTLMAWIKTNQSTTGIFWGRDTATCTDSGFQAGVSAVNTSKFTTHYGGSSWRASNTDVTTGTWNHVAVVYNNSHFLYYLNGSADGVQASSTNVGGTQMDLGRCGNANYYVGILDELLIYNTTLSSADITAIMNSALRDADKNATAVSLWINNAQANITTECSATNHNYTAKVNVTGLNVSILYNGTHAVTNTTTANWYASLISGFWNITANYSGNASYYASSQTFWHNITKGNATSNVSLTFNTSNTTYVSTPTMINCSAYVLEDSVYLYSDTSLLTIDSNFTPPTAGTYNFTCNWTSGDCYNAGSVTRTLTAINPPTANYSYIICSTNSTLWEHDAVYNNGSFAFNDTYTLCTYNCDNVTYPAMCNPSTYQSNVMTMFIIVIIIIGMILVFKFVRG